MLFLKKNQQVFFALVKAGLWEDIRVKGEGLRVNDSSIDHFSSVDWQEVMRIAEEQSVEGLVTAGLKYVPEDRIPQDDLLEFIGLALQIEQQNRDMNVFLAKLIEKLRKADIDAVLVKGQGIAQCYEKPLWRTCGDVDLFLSDNNYEKAKAFLMPLASSVETENEYTKHQGMLIDSWAVEIHGTLRSELSSKIDKVLDEVKDDVFYGGNVRSWLNGQMQVFLMSANNDVIYVFTHILQHFFKGGIGLRQVSDWCRLLYTYKDSLNHGLLESRIKNAGLMSEWRAFAALAVEWLGMPKDAMPFYSDSSKWKRKCKRILFFILETGNFGHNRDDSYLQNYYGFKRKVMRFNRITRDTITHFLIFPLDSLKIWWGMMMIGLRVFVKGL